MQARDAGGVLRLQHQLGITLALSRDGAHCINKEVELFLGLALGGSIISAPWTIRRNDMVGWKA